VDYPKPIVDHDLASKENMARMKVAYDAHKALAAGSDGARYGPSCVSVCVCVCARACCLCARARACFCYVIVNAINALKARAVWS
jgi:hypothetical protein